MTYSHTLNFSETPDKKKRKLVPAPREPSHVRDTMSSLGVSNMSLSSRSSHSSHSKW